MPEATGQHGFLLLRAGQLVVALPLAAVVETMRPLPAEAVAQLPAHVRGLAIVRGRPIPVVDLAGLLGGSGGSPGRRFVTLRIGERTLALAVEAVLGTWQPTASALGDVPALLGRSAVDLVEQVGVLDADLVLLLRLARILPEPAWLEIERATAGT